MRLLPIIFVVFSFAAIGQAQPDKHERKFELEQLSEIFARKGDAVLTQADWDAFLSRIPSKDHVPFLVSHERVGDALDRLLLVRLLASEAEKRGALENDIVVSQLIQAIMVYLAETELEHAWQENQLDDYTEKAREHYRLNEQEYTAEPSVDFTYLRLALEDRGEESASELAEKIVAMLEEGESFDALVEEYTEDPEFSETNGHYEDVAIDDLEPTVKEVLVDDLEESEISEPVVTPYGVIIVRLDRINRSGRILPFEDVRDEVIETVKREHRDEVHARYKGRLISQPLELEEGAVRKLYERYGVPDAEARRNRLTEIYSTREEESEDDE